MFSFLPESLEPYLFITAAAGLSGLVFAFIGLRHRQTIIQKKKQEIEHKIFESRVLQEIGERISYELDTSKILDTIMESLNQLVSFSLVGYLLIPENPERVEMKMHLTESVSRGFVDTVVKYTLETLSEIDPHSRFTPAQVLETLSGAIIDSSEKEAANSLWLTPLTIDNRAIGVLVMASKKPGQFKGSEMDVLTKILSQANRAVARLESIISAEQTKLNSLVISMADGVLMFDQDLNLLVVNPATIALLNLPSDRKITVLDIIQSLANKLDLRSKIDESIREDKIVIFDNLEVGGKMSQLLISPAKDSNKRLLGTVIIFHDITAQKQLEKIREDFTAMMVHELRAPLTVVRGTTDMLVKNPDLVSQKDGQNLLESMEKSSNSMLSLVNDLLDVAKIDSGKFQVLKTRNNLADVVKERVAFFDQMAKSRSLVLTADVSGEDLTADFDRERISQVLNNLLSNAIKFTSPGGKIAVSAKKINSMSDINWRYSDPPKVNLTLPAILVFVSDTGAGIPAEKIPDLFSKFKQFHPLNSEDSGTGLGLVIAKGIVESHQGQIFLESRPVEGTTFFFSLPL